MADCIKLFDTDNYSEKRALYAKFYKEITHNKPLTSHQELEEYRNNIKFLLNCNDYVTKYLRFYTKEWGNYVDMAVDLSKDLGNIVINKDIYKSFKVYNRLLNEEEKLGLIRSIYIPQTRKELKAYLYDCHYIYTWFLWKMLENSHNLNFHNEDVNKFLNYIYSIYDQYEEVNFFFNSEMISLIFAYLHYYDKDNYDLVRQYLDNQDYYLEKMKMNDCLIYDEILHASTGHHYDSYDLKRGVVLFNNLESFLNKEKEIIR